MVSVPFSQKREVLPNSLEQKEAAQQFLAVF
jgi:hypothetical protein